MGCASAEGFLPEECVCTSRGYGAAGRAIAVPECKCDPPQGSAAVK